MKLEVASLLSLAQMTNYYLAVVDIFVAKKGQVEFVTTESLAADFRFLFLSCMYTARSDDNMRSQYACCVGSSVAS